MLAVISWPILERIPLVGELAVSPHGIATAAGFVVGARMMVRRADAWGIGVEVEDTGPAITDLLTWVALGAIVGARFFYVVNHLDEFATQPWAVLALWRGGLTLLGGITGGTVTGIVIARRRGWSPRRLVDAAAAGLAAGIAIGRLGDLAIGDHLGAVAADSWWAWRCTGNLWVETTNSFGRVAPSRYPLGIPPVQGCFDVPVVQTAMFDAIAASMTLVVLLLVERRIRGRDPGGLLAATFVIAYGSGRLALDSLRGDVRHAGLTASQWTALAAVTIAVTWVLRRRTTPSIPPVGPDRTPPQDDPAASADDATATPGEAADLGRD